MIKYFNLTKNEFYFVITVFLFVSSLLIFTFYGPNYNGTGKEVELNIPQGATFNSVVEKLEEKRVINSKFFLKIAGYLIGVENNIKAGHYTIPDGISYIRLLDLLNEGIPAKQKLITIQEGIWQRDLAELLAREFSFTKEEVLKLSKDKEFFQEIGFKGKNLEGYLLPNSYYFYEDASAKDVLKKLYLEMNKIFEPDSIKSQMKKLKMNKHQILTMASIIDGESNKLSEFRRISGVYYNRLRNGWKLQADPTVQYIVRQRRKKVNKIYYKDLEIDSKYNTYMYYGLPPSPINNPGKDAILAALYPEKHDLYYFVADGKSGHRFSKTSSEHQRNVQRYRNWRMQNN